MTLGELKIKPKKLPALPWIEEYIDRPKKGSRKIDLSKYHLFSSQFDELHQEFSIENRRQKDWNFSEKKLSNINSDETLKMRHDNYVRDTISHPSLIKLSETISKKQLPKLDYTIESSKPPEKMNNQSKIPQIDFIKNKRLISRIRREKEYRYNRQVIKYI